MTQRRGEGSLRFSNKRNSSSVPIVSQLWILSLSPPQFGFFNRAPLSASPPCARTKRDRPGFFQWHLVLPANPPSSPLESYIPAKASFTVTVLETRNDQNNFFMRGPLEDAGLSFFGCLDLVLPGCYLPPFRASPGSPYTVYNHGEIQPLAWIPPLFYASYLRYNIYTDSI